MYPSIANKTYWKFINYIMLNGERYISKMYWCERYSTQLIIYTQHNKYPTKRQTLWTIISYFQIQQLYTWKYWNKIIYFQKFDAAVLLNITYLTHNMCTTKSLMSFCNYLTPCATVRILRCRQLYINNLLST